MKRNVALYLKDIIENMDRAERFVKGMSYEDFARDEKTGFAVIRCIESLDELIYDDKILKGVHLCIVL